MHAEAEFFIRDENYVAGDRFIGGGLQRVQPICRTCGSLIGAAKDTYLTYLRELGTRPQVYIKLSEVVHKFGDRVSTDVAVYRDWLDELWSIFGEDRVMFGSDWPQSESLEFNSYPNVFGVAQAYVKSKGPSAWRRCSGRIPCSRTGGSSAYRASVRPDHSHTALSGDGLCRCVSWPADERGDGDHQSDGAHRECPGPAIRQEGPAARRGV